MSDELVSLRKMQVLSWVCLLILCGGSWVFFSWEIAWAVAVGGVISIVSFMLTHQDVARFMKSLDSSEEGQEEKKALKVGKARYIIKFWLRLAIIGLVLLMLIKSGKVNIFGLLVGLSTVVFTITLTTVGAAGRYIISSRR
ncbi:MAG: ATP synthase subunit I [Proteobacteria bacterium]|nr:ATP synthase subunit I [Desulfocapsa sp.]MBU3945128.1 ATP synthase subunit I [Pseudomonadota bacterium]MCG2743159.1 ATP synthase subunit I [Desulfobacteraceae bacterium]MDO8946788.1 ATP synthase subunit I [Desulfocapsaceae bacterium]MBU4028598.1 ATP synthase subunit I [Pseudomonadota bacterium]